MPNPIGQSLQSSNLTDFVVSYAGNEQAAMATLTRQYLLNDASSLLNRMSYLKDRIDKQKEPEKRARLEEIEKEAKLLHANLKEKLEANKTGLDAPAELRAFDRLLDEAHACSAGNAHLVVPTDVNMTSNSISHPGLSGRVFKVVESIFSYGSNSSVVRHQISLAPERNEVRNRPQPAAVVTRKQIDEARPIQSAPIQPRASDDKIKILEHFRTSNPYADGSSEHCQYDKLLGNLQNSWPTATDKERDECLVQAAHMCKYGMFQDGTWSSGDDTSSATRKLIEDLTQPRPIVARTPDPGKPPFDLAAAEEKFQEIVQSNPYKSEHKDHRDFAETLGRLQSQWERSDVVGKENLLVTAVNAHAYAKRMAAKP